MIFAPAPVSPALAGLGESEDEQARERERLAGEELLTNGAGGRFKAEREAEAAKRRAGMWLRGPATATLSLLGLGPAAQEPEVDERAELLARLRRRDAEDLAAKKRDRKLQRAIDKTMGIYWARVAEANRAAHEGEAALMAAIEGHRQWRMAHPEIAEGVRAEIRARYERLARGGEAAEWAEIEAQR